MDATLAPLAGLFALNTDLLLNALDDVTEDQGVARVGGQTNHIVFLVSHLVNTRHRLAATLGSPGADPVAQRLEGARSLDDVESFPSLAELRPAWQAAGDRLAAALAGATAAQLAAPVARPLPNGDPTVLGTIAFHVQHESYHLGQVAWLRRALGLPAMTYRRRA